MDKSKVKAFEPKTISIGRVSKDWVHFEDGSKYKGQWLGLDKDGDGILVSSDGSVYEGKFREDRPNGIGKNESSIGTYTGGWLNGLRHGYGEETWIQTGDRYQGNYVNGAREGRGKLQYADGSTYEGDFKNNELQGTGKMAYANGSVYEGEW